MRDDLGRLLLRLTVAGLMLFHGINKLGHGIGGIRQRVIDHGLPAFVAHGVFIGEVVVPLLIIAGIFTRPAAAIFSFNMVVALYLAHTGDIFALGKAGGWAIELQMLYLLGGVCIMLLGPGRYSLSRGLGRGD
jgi:putative oxidoreductase